LPLIIDPEYHYETVNVEAQQSNPSSLLWWVKRLISLRKKFRAFGRGSLELLRPANPKVLAFIRKHEDEHILVVANLSRFVQYVQLDLKEYAGVVPEELTAGTEFPQVGDQPYLLTLGPHGFIWFLLPTSAQLAPAALASASSGARDGAELDLPVLAKIRPQATRFGPGEWEELETLLPQYLVRNRLLFSRAVASTARILQIAPIKVAEVQVWFLVVRVEPRGGATEDISLGLTFVPEDQSEQLLAPLSMAALGRITGPEPGLLCDPLAVPACCRGFLRGILGGRSRRLVEGEIESAPLPATTERVPEDLDNLSLSLQRSERNNTSIVYDESFILKIFRRVEEGTNPDLEIGRYLSERPDYQGAAPVVGYIEFRRPDAQPTTLAVLHRYVLNQGTAWQYTLDQLSRFCERVAALSLEQPPSPPRPLSFLEPAGGDTEYEQLGELMGGYLDTARLLGQRTAELHQTLASNQTDPALSPESFGKLYQRSLYQSMRNLTGRLCDRLARRRTYLAESVRPLADQIINQHDTILKRFQAILDPTFDGKRIRCHGDYHLGQLLYTGKDFVIIDFEGEAGRTIGERRVKSSPLRDVACMIRSLDYAVQSVILGLSSGRGRPPGMIRPEDRPFLEPWADAWYQEVVRQMVLSFNETLRPAGLLPKSTISCARLLDLLVLEKALVEVDAELTARIDWIVIPLQAVVRMLGQEST
jgi:maltose alpha-D-glucosyltransferase/alpha-amylase